jgi:hypothetical protein
VPGALPMRRGRPRKPEPESVRLGDAGQADVGSSCLLEDSEAAPTSNHRDTDDQQPPGTFIHTEDENVDVPSNDIPSLNIIDHLDSLESGSCECTSIPQPADRISLMDQAEQWASCVPGNDLHDWGSSMLTRSILPSRTEYDDFRDIDFTRALFATRQTAKLSMALSEVADADTVPIRHSYDIDSTVLLLKSLAALRGAMDMSYYPHYFASLREPVRFDVQVNGQPVHKMKNVMLGEPIMGPKNMRINVFFPYLPLGRTKEQYLSKLEFQHWVDGVLIPSVAAVAPPDVLQHHPHTWDAAHAQSQTAREANIGGRTHNLSSKYVVPADLLGLLWDEIVRRSERYEMAGDAVFRRPMLLAYQHGSKLAYRASTRRRAARMYMDRFLAAFDIDFVDPAAYIDIGKELVPADGALTLLWKTPCIKHFAHRLRTVAGVLGHAGEQVSTWDQYTWSLTGDAASVQFTINKNRLGEAGLAHGQMYNSDKNIFSTHIRKFGPFSNPALERVGMADEGHLHQKRGRHVTPYAAVVGSMLRVSNRVAAGLQGAEGTSYGVRQEVRVSLFRVMEWLDRAADDDDAPFEVAAGAHRAFWVLPTATACTFRRANVERFAWVLHAAAARASRPPPGFAAVTHREQLLNCAAVICCVRLLRYMFAHQPCKLPGVWRNRIPQQPAGDEEPPPPMRGLDLQGSIDRHGTAWLPLDLFATPPTAPPTPREATLGQMAVFMDSHLRHVKRTVTTYTNPVPHVRGALPQENKDRCLHLLAAAMRAGTDITRCLRTAAQCAVRAYVVDVFNEIHRRWLVDAQAAKDVRRKRQRVTLDEWLRGMGLDRDESRGIWGLDLQMLWRLAGVSARTVTRVKQAPRTGLGTLYAADEPWEQRLSQYLAVGLTDRPRWRRELDEPQWPAKVEFARTMAELKRVFCAEAARRTGCEAHADGSTFDQAVLREAGISLWVALASDKDNFCRVKQCRQRQADGRPMPTYSSVALVSIAWESLRPRDAPRAQSRACRHDITRRQTRIATDAKNGHVWTGPKSKDRPLFE